MPPDGLSSILKTHMVERIDSHMLSSNFYVTAAVSMCIHAYTHTYTHDKYTVKKFLRRKSINRRLKYYRQSLELTGPFAPTTGQARRHY